MALLEGETRVEAAAVRVLGRRRGCRPFGSCGWARGGALGQEGAKRRPECAAATGCTGRWVCREGTSGRLVWLAQSRWGAKGLLCRKITYKIRPCLHGILQGAPFLVLRNAPGVNV